MSAILLLFCKYCIFAACYNDIYKFTFEKKYRNMKMEIERLKAIALYVLNAVPGKCIGKHELFKILYFASQKQLVRYGYPMISDFYAFKYGPVPS